MPDTNAFYVGISDPVQLRRMLLECSKQILQSLQDYEVLQHTREEKIKQMIQLKYIIKEIYTLNDQLGRVIPKIQLRASKEEKEMPLPENKRKKDLDSFESELDKIEEKLNSLGV
jgi:hypothetical protein